MSGQRLPVALAAIVGLAAIPLAAAALESDAAQTESTIPADAQIVARDAATGQLRPATAEEAQALRRSHARSRAGGMPTSARHAHWSGARGARLTDEFMSYSVVVRTADGKLVELCVEDPAALTAQPRSSTLPTE